MKFECNMKAISNHASPLRTPGLFLGIIAGFVFLVAFFAGIGASASMLTFIMLLFGIITFSIGMLFLLQKQNQ